MNRYLIKLREYLWDLEAMARHPKRWVRVGRYAFVLGRDLVEGQLNMRAMSLVYTTLLSIVPLLALAFSVLKALGAHNSLEPVLLEFLRPLGSRSFELTDNIITFVEKIDVGVLGSVGVALLFYSAISLIQKVEESFNFIWRVERPRPLSQRFGEYFAVLTVGPVLIFTALGITGTVMNSTVMLRIVEIEPFGLLVYLASKVVPYLMIVGAFTFFYSFMPNTRVKTAAAAWGGLLAGVLWQSGSVAFASFVTTATNYNAVYSGFAIVIFLLLWLYLGWLILLIGCQLAFYVQHPEYLKPLKAPSLMSGRQVEYLSLLIMALVGRRFMQGATAYTSEELSLALNAEPEHVARVTDGLIFHGLLTEAGADRTSLVPSMDLESLSLARLWRLSRAGYVPLPKSAEPMAKDVIHMLDEAERSLEQGTGGISLRAWLERSDPPR